MPQRLKVQVGRFIEMNGLSLLGDSDRKYPFFSKFVASPENQLIRIHFHSFFTRFKTSFSTCFHVQLWT